ncbi:MAG: hypothetical protein H7Y30_05560 [Pyrinomonadaceae bacterium]|nr:hypothetical protein [Pyrinomonadaceae bacterium]
MPLEFQRMWDSHPSNKNDSAPCRNADGLPAFINQCAIRMGLALAGGGMNMTACNKAKCWYRGHVNHVLRAQELADWLAGAAQLGVPTKFIKRRDVTTAVFGSNVQSGINGKKGVVFCQNFYGSGNQGDHIDAWDGTQMAQGSVSYFEGAQQVWFWEVTV